MHNDTESKLTKGDSRASVTADLLDNLGLDDDEKDVNSDAWLAPMINRR